MDGEGLLCCSESRGPVGGVKGAARVLPGCYPTLFP